MSLWTWAARCCRAAMAAAGVALAACGGGGSPSASDPMFSGGAATDVAVLPADATAPRSTIESGGKPLGIATQINVLSNRADLISGGDALVEVVLSSGGFSSIASVDVDGRDVTPAFAVRTDGRYRGLVTGLANGVNVLRARLTDGSGARINITNHPSSGPVFSGPQVQPWSCNAGASDTSCSRDPQTVPGTINGPAGPDSYFQTYDPANPPAPVLVAQTTTDQGKTVPMVVRVETGSIGRAQYQIAVLFDPAKPWTLAQPQQAWNHKLFMIGGASCGVSYQEGTAPGLLYGKVLGRGFALISSALDVTGNDCNLVTQAEALSMAKEHFIEAYGTVRYTMSIGGSGASIVQQWIANAYPGLYDGLIVEASFPDAWTELINTEDCISLLGYWTDPTKWAPGVAWGPAEQSSVESGDVPSSCAAFMVAFKSLFTPADETGQIPAGGAYSPMANAAGVRGTIWDYSVAQLGRRPASAWGFIEQSIGMGFANRPLDTVGIQYGLKALSNRQITPAQFVDLNAKVGGHDIDYNPQPQRTIADPAALTVVYRSGYLNQANNMHLPIIDIRGTSNADLHDTFHSWSMRARLDRANGNHDNQVIWDSFTASGFVVDPTLEAQAFDLMDRWLTAIEADTRNQPLAQKVASDKPSDAVDRCAITGTGLAGPCVIPASGSPRLNAGEPLTDDTAKCSLKAMNRTDYFPALFTDAQWSQLQQAFPTGVCDYSRPGINQQATLPWLSYTAGPGGQPLGTPPASTPFTR
jgi:hypothetical protein